MVHTIVSTNCISAGQPLASDRPSLLVVRARSSASCSCGGGAAVAAIARRGGRALLAIGDSPEKRKARHHDHVSPASRGCAREDRLGESKLVPPGNARRSPACCKRGALAASMPVPVVVAVVEGTSSPPSRARRARRLAIFRPRQRARAHGRARLPRGHLRPRCCTCSRTTSTTRTSGATLWSGRSTSASSGTTSTRTSWSSASTPSAWTRCARTTLFLEMSSDAGRTR